MTVRLTCLAVIAVDWGMRGGERVEFTKDIIYCEVPAYSHGVVSPSFLIRVC